MDSGIAVGSASQLVSLTTINHPARFDLIVTQLHHDAHKRLFTHRYFPPHVPITFTLTISPVGKHFLVNVVSTVT